MLIEGLALAAFGFIRNLATEPLARAVNAYVMQDEARHVMFGRLALRDYYPQLTQAERDEIGALVDYNTAIAALHAATGTALERNRIQFVVPDSTAPDARNPVPPKPAKQTHE